MKTNDTIYRMFIERSIDPQWKIAEKLKQDSFMKKYGYSYQNPDLNLPKFLDAYTAVSTIDELLKKLDRTSWLSPKEVLNGLMLDYKVSFERASDVLFDLIDREFLIFPNSNQVIRTEKEL